MGRYDDIPASPIPGDTGRTTRVFPLDDEYWAWARFHQRVEGRSYGYAGWDALVSVYRRPERHITGVPDRLSADDVLVRNTGGRAPTAAQIIAAARTELAARLTGAERGQ